MVGRNSAWWRRKRSRWESPWGRRWRRRGSEASAEALRAEGGIQSGRNNEARLLYAQALKIAPDQASIHANLGLSYAMTNELDKAESELRMAVKMRGATTQVRQNLALVVGLQGRFEESRTLFAAELPPDQVEANMAYIRSLLTQQNRWDLVKQQG